jgi:3',5'-cyclic AMP phosphodiesterase CpdA
MDRRKILKGVAASAVAPLIWSNAHVAPASDRHGDLLMEPLATDHWRLMLTTKQPRPLRLLQLTDTHFHGGDNTNGRTEETLRSLVANHRPDFIVHTGDFVNNDSKHSVDWTGLDILNGLGLPWTLCFGNHDYPVHRAEGSRSLEEIRTGMQRGYQGFADRSTGRHYCYRYDLLKADDASPSACLFFFQVGYAEGDRRISDPQLDWFQEQLARDREANVVAPITVFVHIPLLEYNSLYEAGMASGVRGESVCFDSDTGRSFQAFALTQRVAAVFCGHDHVNNFHGVWKGIDLVYGRVSGWGGYGPATWSRGGRLITLDLSEPQPITQHTEVF